MAQQLVLSFSVLLIISVVAFCFMGFAYIRAKDEIQGLRKALAGKHRDPEEVATSTQDRGTIMNGLVTKTSRSHKGRTAIDYARSEKFPQFKDEDEALSWLSGFLGMNEDPTVANIAPYGLVMSTDQYMGLKVVVGGVLQQMSALASTPRESEGSIETEK